MALHVGPLMLLLDQRFLILLQSLELDLFLCDELDGELISLFDDEFVGLLFLLRGSAALHDAIEHDGAGIDVIGLQQLLTDPNLASDDRMHV